MRVEEIWAIAYERIEAFFLSEKDVEILGPGKYTYHNSEIHLTRLDHKPVGPLKVPQTCVAISGEEADVERIHRKFFLRFVSAGG